MSTSYIVLLRGINVGGNNKVSMEKLKAFLGDCGFKDAKTLLQSGNAVVKGEDEPSPELESRLREEAKTQLGINCEFFVIKLQEWREIIRNNPFSKEAESDPSHLLIHLFKEAQDSSLIEKIEAENPGPETLRSVGRCVYAAYPVGIGTSQLYKNRPWTKLCASSTARNWNTAVKLEAMASALSVDA
jgi:uncharacterized protein (DUF1697 family)